MLNEKNRFKRRMTISILIFIIITTLCLLGKINLKEFYNSNPTGGFKDFQFNLLSFSAIIAGFMFTSLSLLLSVSDNKIISEIKQLNFWDTIHRTLLLGIYFSLISIVLASFIIFISMPNNASIVLAYLEINLIVLSITFFIFSVKDVEYIIKTIRRSDKTNRLKEPDIQELKSRIDN